MFLKSLYLICVITPSNVDVSLGFIYCAEVASLSTARGEAGNDESSGYNYSAPSGAYIHLPFCKRKCLYCDFPVKVYHMT